MEITIFGGRFDWLMVKCKVVPFPDGMTVRNLFGIALPAAIGFTMYMFITCLAFNIQAHITQKKNGIFAASIVGGIAGYVVLKKSAERPGRRELSGKH
ncbi:MAG: hypothetical protein DI535_04820 [Citrobacter freundii]|nr:MAG: hypothetical protein DI535_04820 [Citrobacter freundii]